jgi:hypothetical protein
MYFCNFIMIHLSFVSFIYLSLLFFLVNLVKSLSICLTFSIIQLLDSLMVWIWNVPPQANVFVFVFANTGFEHRVLCLLGRHSITLAIHPSPFCSGYFRESHFLPRPTWHMILLFYTFCCHWDDRWMSPHLAFFH